MERTKQLGDHRHLLYGHSPATPRLHSRRSFASSVRPLRDPADTTRVQLWQDHLNVKEKEGHGIGIPAAESLPPGAQLQWTTWKCLNRLRAGVGRCKADMVKWGYHTPPDLCSCGDRQTMKHLLVCPHIPSPTTVDDLAKANSTALDCATFWKDTV